MCHNIKLSVDLRLFVRISVWPQRRAAGNPRDNGQLLVSSLSSNSPSKCHILLPHPSPGLACLAFQSARTFTQTNGEDLAPGGGRAPEIGKNWSNERRRESKTISEITISQRTIGGRQIQMISSPSPALGRNFLTIINKRSPRNQPLQRQTIALSINLLQHLSFHFSPKLNSRFLILHN